MSALHSPHPEVEVGTYAGMPWPLIHAPNGVHAPAPLLGQDTEWVLRDLLGYSAAEIAALAIRADVGLRLAVHTRTITRGRRLTPYSQPDFIAAIFGLTYRTCK